MRVRYNPPWRVASDIVSIPYAVDDACRNSDGIYCLEETAILVGHLIERLHEKGILADADVLEILGAYWEAAE